MLISELLSFLKTATFLILLNDYFKRNFPERYEEILVNVSFHLINMYSQSQIFYVKIYSKITKFIEANPYLKKKFDEIYKKNIQQNEIYQIKNDGQIHIKYYTDNSENYFEHDDSSIYLFSDNQNKCVNKVILHSQPFLTDYEVSNIKFLLVEIKIDNKAYKVDLKTDEYNYYIVNNILDKKFFVYFFRNYQLYQFTDTDYDSIKFVIKILDHNCNLREFEITDDKFIIIKKDDYNY
jgi:hypothetical protein